MGKGTHWNFTLGDMSSFHGEKKKAGVKEINYVISKGSVSGRGNSLCKGPEAGACPEWLKNREAQAEGVRGIVSTAFLSSRMHVHDLYPILCISLVFTSYWSWLPKWTVNSKNRACDFYSLYTSGTLKPMFTESICLCFVDSMNHKVQENEQILSGKLLTPLPTSPPTLVVNNDLYLC